MKKLIALLLAAVMLFALAACSETAQTETKPAETKPTAAAPAEEKVKPADSKQEAEAVDPEAKSEDDASWIIAEDTSISGKVRFWSPFKGGQGMDDLIAGFNEIYPNIEVELVNFNNNTDGNVALDAAIMAGEVDVLLSGNLIWTAPRWENGLFVDLTDRMAAEGIDEVANWGTNYYDYNGRCYCWPTMGQMYYIVINMDAWNEAGLGELPSEWTWDEYLAASEAMTVRDANGEPVIYGGSDINSIETFAYVKKQIYGTACNFDDETGLSSYGDPLLLNSLKRELKAELEDKIWYPLADYRATGIQCNEEFMNHHTNSTITFNTIRLMRDTETYKLDSLIGFAPYPVEEKGQKNFCEGPGVYIFNAICTGCQDEEAAWCFLKYCSTVGAIHYTKAGYFPTYKGTDLSTVAATIFGSDEDAAKIVDLDSFNRVIADGIVKDAWFDQVWSTSSFDKVRDSYVLSAANGEISAEEALSKAQAEADELIKAAW